MIGILSPHSVVCWDPLKLLYVLSSFHSSDLFHDIIASYFKLLPYSLEGIWVIFILGTIIMYKIAVWGQRASTDSTGAESLPSTQLGCMQFLAQYTVPEARPGVISEPASASTPVLSL